MISRIVIVGKGNSGQRHSRLLKELLPKAEIRYVRRPSTGVGVSFSDTDFTTLNEVISFDPHVAIIANPSTFHIVIANYLARIGTHLFIEKPLSASLEGVTELIELCRQTQRILQVGYNLRFSDSLQFFHDYLAADKIGQIFSVRCEVGQNLKYWRPNKDYRESVSAQKELGGGALLELSHELDYLRWIFGEVDWVRATLFNASNLEIDVEDSAHIVMGFSNLNSSNEIIGSLNLDFVRQDQTRICIAIGEESSLRWNGLTNTVDIYENSLVGWRELFSREENTEESYKNELLDFITCVRDGLSPRVTGFDGMRVLEIIEAIRQSSNTGTQIQVPKTQLRGGPAE